MSVVPSFPDPLLACLATQHGLGPVGFARLLGRFGSAEGVYGAEETAWRETHPRLSDQMVASLRKGPDFGAWTRLQDECARHGIAIAFPPAPHYPRVLRTLGEEDGAPPPVLFMKGAWREADARAVALVGTRNPSPYGREAARVLARDLAASGCAVVSGLAVGVDAIAHAGALEVNDGRTIAVVGCGLDIDYPAENRAVRAAIEERGVVVSEHPPGTEARAAFFPRRNRLISALARATVVVEAGAASGALITADFARRQGRAVFAVPGPIFSAGSAGTSALLRAGARLAASAEDIISGIEGRGHDGRPANAPPSRLMTRVKSERSPRPSSSSSRPRRAQASQTALSVPRAPLDPVLASVLNLWVGDPADEACPLDTLAARATDRGVFERARAAPALLEALLALELRGLVRRAPGGVYRRVGG